MIEFDFMKNAVIVTTNMHGTKGSKEHWYVRVPVTTALSPKLGAALSPAMKMVREILGELSTKTFISNLLENFSRLRCSKAFC